MKKRADGMLIAPSFWEAMADAALDALAEPTDEMLLALVKIYEDPRGSPEIWGLPLEDRARAVGKLFFGAMIRAARAGA